MTMKERIKMINEMAQTNFDIAKGMLEMLNNICGTKFNFLAKRVVFSEYPGTAEDNCAAFYAKCHDAYVYF